jgi:hypothetical protein
MLDVFNIPGQQDSVKIFYTQGDTSWQTWTRPRNCKFVWIMCIGGGSGGFGGAGSGGAANSLGGPGAAVTKALFPANVLPDTLYVQVGTGSIGGAGAITNINNLPSVPGRSFISIVPSSTTTMNIVCTSGLANAASSTPETAATVAAAGLLSLGTFTSTAGVAPVAAGSSVTPLVSTITCPGANGSPAGNAAGAGILSVNLGTFNTPLISGGASGLIGNNGAWSWKPIVYGLGASGGGGVTSGTAGNGGDANSYGCGGGGGGNSGAGTGGNGGRGGDGLVIIATF